MNPTEPKWKSLVVETIAPVFSPQQCQDIINMGESLKKEQAQVGTSQPQGKQDTEKRITTIILFIAIILIVSQKKMKWQLLIMAQILLQ